MRNFKFGTSSKLKMSGLKDKTIRLLDKALMISSVDFGITSGYRTSTEQFEIYNNGQSECDGYDIISSHQFGLAFDLLVYIKDDNGRKINGFNLSNDKVKLAYLEVGRAVLRAARLLGLCVEWGITYNIDGKRDIYHFQINE